MTPEEAIKLLKSGPNGVSKWNEWWATARATEQPFDLNGAPLFNARLGEADLRKTNLEDANFSSATLVWSKLGHARLQRADLHAANLYAADLGGADLSGAKLMLANFSAAILDGTNFAGAVSNNTYWVNVDLSKAKGLETIRHTGPSTVGVDTLIISRGKISREFLLGCGVPQSLINLVPKLIDSMEDIQFFSCFISHSKDNEFCNLLYSRMQKAGLNVFLDDEDLKAGQNVREQIKERIKEKDKLLLILSQDSMNSAWVKEEIILARQKEKRDDRRVLFPIRLCTFDAIRRWECVNSDTGEDLARIVREYFIGDFENWKDGPGFTSAFDELLKNLRSSSPSAGE